METIFFTSEAYFLSDPKTIGIPNPGEFLLPGQQCIVHPKLRKTLETLYTCRFTEVLAFSTPSIANEDVVTKLLKVQVLFKDGTVPKQFWWFNSARSLYNFFGVGNSFFITVGELTHPGLMKLVNNSLDRVRKGNKAYNRACVFYDQQLNTMYRGYGITLMPPNVLVQDKLRVKREVYSGD
jgi:hypothetical protein